MTKKEKNIKENIIEKTEEIVENITEKPKQKIEEIKKDAKKYYKGKNMVSRYILILFLLILLVLQFLLPSLEKKSDIVDIDIPVASGDVAKVDTGKNISTIDSEFHFLGNTLDINNRYYDEEMAIILSSLPQLEVLYKKSLNVLPSLSDKFEKEGIPTDFKYLSLINGLNSHVRMLPGEAVEKYNLISNENIDELLNYKKTTDVTILYLLDLYDKFGDWNLVLVGYLVGGDSLEDMMKEQNETEFDKLYFEPYIKARYYDIVAYKNIFEHISDYIDTSDIKPYPLLETKTITIRGPRDIKKRSMKEGYSIKEVMELNPWILGDVIPKGKREVDIYDR